TRPRSATGPACRGWLIGSTPSAARSRFGAPQVRGLRSPGECRPISRGHGPMDAQLVETLNRWFAANVFRADLCRALAIVPLGLIGVLVVLAWSTPRSNAPVGRSDLLLGIVAAVGALLLNLALGHRYFRARPSIV